MTDDKLAIRPTVELTHAAPAYLSPTQQQLLKDTVCKDATDDEFAFAVAQCERLKLDPFARQVFFVKRWDSSLRREVMASQVSIDGFRLIAQRTGKYRGQTKPEWCGRDGVWREVWLDDEPPAAARCGVYHEDFREPLFAVARYRSYVQTKKGGEPTQMWVKMDDLMLHKCAEALALRKACPNELSGVYVPEEMGQEPERLPQQRFAQTTVPESNQLEAHITDDNREAIVSEYIDRIRAVSDRAELKDIFRAAREAGAFKSDEPAFAPIIAACKAKSEELAALAEVVDQAPADVNREPGAEG